ncbi:glycosyltransferase family 8 protein [Butyrivibrio proteoclasticus]|uniref:glycosyltransferase family 8 protein n=1 Tax=Butyrivibrio proteoclasticus TaxID=43305 RepID=UPI00047A4008|nr:glycosyltransferase [Butyrivibrio proteoclasticus]
MNNKIPVVLISDDNFIMPTCVAITSLIVNKAPDTEYDIYIIMAECSDESYAKIKELNELGTEVNLVRASLDEYRDIKQMAHIPIACLLKFDVSELVPNYDKLLYLDGDIIVRGDLSELYNTELGDSYAAGVKGIGDIYEPTGNVNAGIMLFNARRIRDEKLNIKMREVRRSLGDRSSMDQQTYNIVTGKNYKYVDIKFNCIPPKIEEELSESDLPKINELYGSSYTSLHDIIDKAVIIHFASGAKPWIYTFKPWAKEWYKYYLMSPYKNVEFKLRGIWSYRFDKLRKIGVSGILADRKKRREEKKKKVKWE